MRSRLLRNLGLMDQEQDSGATNVLLAEEKKRERRTCEEGGEDKARMPLKLQEHCCCLLYPALCQHDTAGSLPQFPGCSGLVSVRLIRCRLASRDRGRRKRQPKPRRSHRHRDSKAHWLLGKFQDCARSTYPSRARHNKRRFCVSLYDRPRLAIIAADETTSSAFEARRQRGLPAQCLWHSGPPQRARRVAGLSCGSPFFGMGI